MFEITLAVKRAATYTMCDRAEKVSIASFDGKQCRCSLRTTPPITQHCYAWGAMTLLPVKTCNGHCTL